MQSASIRKKEKESREVEELKDTKSKNREIQI